MRIFLLFSILFVASPSFNAKKVHAQLNIEGVLFCSYVKGFSYQITSSEADTIRDDKIKIQEEKIGRSTTNYQISALATGD
ncbi:unnamed protein product [Caenorhabditis nigoni]